MGYNKVMLFVDMMNWWYGAGWRQRSQMVQERLTQTLDFFSIDLLLKTFFSPFRQISAGKVRGSLDVQFRAFIDRLISRLIGAMVRSFILFIGIVTILFNAVFGIIVLVFWAFVPLLPVFGLIMLILGWTP